MSGPWELLERVAAAAAEEEGYGPEPDEGDDIDPALLDLPVVPDDDDEPGQLSQVERRLGQRYESGGSGVRIAVDLTGELSQLEQLLTEAERVFALAGLIEQRRDLAEETLRASYSDWLGESPRRLLLRTVVDDLRLAVRRIGEAMRASTTVDDEIPF